MAKRRTVTLENRAQTNESSHRQAGVTIASSSEALERYLGEDFIQALQGLNTAYSLPVASTNLCVDLRRWREEVVYLFPAQNKKNQRRKSLRQRWGQKKDVDKGFRSQVRAEATRLFTGDVFVERYKHNSLSNLCVELEKGLKRFSAALEHLAQSHKRDVDHGRDQRLTGTIGKLISTLTGMHATLKEETKEFSEEDMLTETNEDAFNPFLHDFIEGRIEICHAQLQEVRENLTEFCRTVIPRASASQKQAFEDLVNVTQVSTFFAAVVASTLQFSLNINQTPAVVAINTLWLSSLVLGIGSAFNSLLAMRMRKVVSSTPLNAQPWYIKFWIRQSYATLLVFAVIMYVFGLGIFVIKTQHVIAATVPCILGGGCAMGISIASWQHVRDEITSLWTALVESRVRSRSDTLKSDKDTQRLLVLDNITSSFDTGSTSDVSEIVPAADLQMENAPKDQEFYEPFLSQKYVARLQHLKLQVIDNTGSTSGSRWGGIKYMRCSPVGQWLVVCYERACVIYDTEDGFRSQTLTSPDPTPDPLADAILAEHAEWCPDGEHLLTRSKSELHLWRRHTGVDSKKFLFVTSDFEPWVRYHYVKWINEANFLLLKDDSNDSDSVILIMNLNLSLVERWMLDLRGVFNVTQVFPLTSSFDWILCLARKRVDLDEGSDGDGIDYLIVLRDSKFGLEQRNPAHGERRLRNLFRRRIGRREYEVVQKKVLPRSVASVKMCKERRYILINYDRNEQQGTKAPEIWKIGTTGTGEGTDTLQMSSDGQEAETPQKKPVGRDAADKSKKKDHTTPVDIDIDVSEKKGTRKKLPATDGNATDWGEATFTGPTQDIILCEIDGILQFYHFDRSNHTLELKPVYSKRLELEKQSDPVFTWGDTTERPVLFVANANGRGRISMWSTTPEGKRTSTGQLHPASPEIEESRRDEPQDVAYQSEGGKVDLPQPETSIPPADEGNVYP